MPTPLVPNAVKVTVKGSLFGQVVDNVWAVGTTGAPTEAELLTIAAIFQTGYADIQSVLSQDYTVGEITCRYLGDAAGPEATLAIIPPQAGGSINPSSPGSVCLCVSLRTGLAGRRFRGRKYFSGITEVDQTANAIDTDTCNNIVNSILGLMDALSTNGTPLAVVSLVGPTVTQVTTPICVDNFVDSQRRRLTGRGR